MSEAYELSDDFSLLEELAGGSEETWNIDCDGKAEWAVAKIHQAQSAVEAAKARKESAIRFYDEMIAKAQERLERDEAYFYGKLEGYADLLGIQGTKTQRKIDLPSATVIIKHQAPKWDHDDKALLPWVKQNRQDMVKVKTTESVDWSGLKSSIKLVNGKAYDSESGEAIPGVTVTPQPDSYDIKYKEA